MKLTKITASNFLGIRSVDVDLSTPVTLFAGANGAGKSSLQEAVRMALIGESVRVGLKKDYGQIVRDGEKTGFAEVSTFADGVYSIVLPSGKGTCLSDSPALPFVLDAPRFAALAENERRAFLFGLMGLSASGSAVKERLLAKGCDEKKIEAITPILRAGFDAACKEAQQRARDSKTEWRTITGETYGDKKAETWAAANAVFDPAAMTDLQQRLSATDAGLDAANQRMGALQADYKRFVEAATTLEGLREKAARYARIADKLNRDEAELKQWEQKVTALKVSAHSQNALPCPDCGTMLVIKDGVLAHAAPMAKGTDEDIARLPEYTKARDLLARAVENGKRDLAEADTAAKSLADLESVTGEAPDDAEIQAARNHLGDLKAERSQIAAKLAEVQDAERKAKQAEDRTAKALAAHESVLEWTAIADALAPDGIPGEMLSEAIQPFNARLKSACPHEWPLVEIDGDMSIRCAPAGDGKRHYALLSESEKWRADAMLAEAIAHLSGLKLLVLDRMDVLDIPARGQLIGWLDDLACAGELDTALVFGTLKGLPAGLPDTVAAHWIKEGVVEKMEVAA